MGKGFIRHITTMRSLSNSNKNSLLWDALLFIEKKFNQDINLDQIASKSFYSKYHFQREFKNLFTLTPKEYLLQIRNQKALLSLLSTDLSIGDIGFELGFENQETFSRSFKKFFGISPIQFRKKYKNPNNISYPKIPFTIKTIPKTQIIMIRSTKGISGLSKKINKLLDFALLNGVHTFESCFYGKIHDPPRLANLTLKRADIGIEYSSIIKKEILYPFYIDTISEGKYYSVYHFGSLKEIHTTYKSIFSTLNILNKNLIFLNPPYELYHRLTPFFPEEKSITEILIPVEY